MELRHLRYFLAVAETLNISEASRRLRVAQPSLSRQIRDLEFELAYPLFERAKGRLSLTATGKALRKSASRVVVHAEAALADARKAGTRPTAELRVGYYGTRCGHPYRLGPPTVPAPVSKSRGRLFRAHARANPRGTLKRVLSTSPCWVT